MNKNMACDCTTARIYLLGSTGNQSWSCARFSLQMHEGLANRNARVQINLDKSGVGVFFWLLL